MFDSSEEENSVLSEEPVIKNSKLIKALISEVAVNKTFKSNH